MLEEPDSCCDLASLVTVELPQALQAQDQVHPVTKTSQAQEPRGASDERASSHPQDCPYSQNDCWDQQEHLYAKLHFVEKHSSDVDT